MTHSPQQSLYSSRPVAEIDLAVTGMTCASCVSRVEKKLNKLPGVRAAVNLANEQAHVDIFSEGTQLSDEDFINQVKVAGYDGSVIRRANLTPSGKRDVQTDAAQASAAEENAELSHRARLASLTRRFWVSLALFIPIVGISMIPALQFPGWQWLVAALSLPVAFWAGAPFHISAAKSLRHGATTMDTLISLGTLAAMFYSLWALLWGGAGTIGYTMTMTGIHSMAHGGNAPAEVTSLASSRDWWHLKRPAGAGAIDVTEFTTPANNIRCRFGEDNVSCSIYAYDYPSPPGCEGHTATYHVEHAGEVTADCDSELSVANQVDYDQVVSHNNFACSASQYGGVTCWSELSGHGFTLKRSAEDRF